MLFHSLEHALFLIVVFIGFWAMVRLQLTRLVFLLVASYFFYACSNPYFLLLIVASSLTDYLAGLAMYRAGQRDDARAKTVALAISLTFNLGLLAVFKYANFFAGSAAGLLNAFGAGLQFATWDIALPVGISFYTFQSMSYSIDVYRGKIPVERSLLRFFTFVGFFPQLVAGPIVRAADFLPQLGREPYVSPDQVGRALWLISIGLMKKVVIADYLAINLVDRIFDAPRLYSSLETMVGLYGYTMQVYMDFSAYSNIAIGSALLLGFHLPDNFDRPYLATSVTDFWRRWHLTLGSWLRDYLYYPLGGSRGTDYQTYRNLLITFLLIGLWHGANWTFVVYGGFHALAMCINRYFRVNIRKRGSQELTPWGWIWRVFLTLNFVVLARVLFRSQDFGQAWQIYQVLIQGTLGFALMTPTLWFMLVGSFVVHWTPRRWVDMQGERFERLPAIVQGVTVATVALFVMLRASTKAVPFMYFRF
jgi:alginate O-acetyltransferase complex protein AlgI